MSSIEQQVKAIVAEQLGVKEEEVTNDASFVDDLGADSLDTVELVMALGGGVRDGDSGRRRGEDHDRSTGDRLHHRAPQPGLMPREHLRSRQSRLASQVAERRA